MNTTKNNEYIEEEITLAELSERFILNNDFTTPSTTDISDREIEVLTENGYKRILSFLVKPEVESHYTDGNLKGTSEHRIIENGKEIHLKNHADFKLVFEPMKVVDIEVDGGTYLANGRNNHNTTSGGKAIAFHASLRLRLKSVGQIKNADKQAVGIKTKCTIIKNRMGPPMRSVEFDIFFDRGIDNYGNWLEKLIEWDIVTNAKKVKSTEKKTKKQLEDEKEEDKKAKSLQFIMEVQGKEAETVVFEKKDLPILLTTRPECKDYLYNKMCEQFIMKYKDPNSEMSADVEYAEGGDGMED
jgi:hypothetical protein